ncbi:MAG: hypothetical protein ABGZ37_08795 [Akkermansiaceae bacterium]|jgi:hypothetical protein
MKRITISLEDDLYRISKAYAISEDLSLSKAVTKLLRRAVEGAHPSRSSRVREDLPTYTYLDPVTGLLISRGGGTITEDPVKRAEEQDDQRTWDCE